MNELLHMTAHFVSCLKNCEVTNSLNNGGLKRLALLTISERSESMVGKVVDFESILIQHHKLFYH